jgi:hypothetical protein
MMRRLNLFLIASGMLLAGLALAQDPQPEPDDPPIRLKKKPRAEVPPPPEPDKPPVKDDKKDPPKKDDGKGEPEQPPAPQEDEAEVLARVAKNLRLSEEKIANKELTDGTRQLQEDILKDLDSLIKAAENPPPQGGGGGEDNQPNQPNDPQGGMGKQGGGMNKQGQPQGGGSQRASRGSRRGGPEQAKSGGSGSQGNQQARGGEQPKPMNPSEGGGNQGGGGGKSTGPITDKNADLYKDVWGHLPEALRAEMNAYSNDKQFMAKYDELIKRYYRSIAEQGRRKGGD